MTQSTIHYSWTLPYSWSINDDLISYNGTAGYLSRDKAKEIIIWCNENNISTEDSWCYRIKWSPLNKDIEMSTLSHFSEKWNAFKGWMMASPVTFQIKISDPDLRMLFWLQWCSGA